MAFGIIVEEPDRRVGMARANLDCLRPMAHLHECAPPQTRQMPIRGGTAAPCLSGHDDLGDQTARQVNVALRIGPDGHLACGRDFFTEMIGTAPA